MSGHQWHTHRAHTVFIHDRLGSDASISTTATAPNLPGTGRVIGLAYDALGKVLVKRVNRIAHRLRKRRHGRQSGIVGGDQSVFESQRLDVDAVSVLSVSTFSTTATQANLPGAGRVLGLAYDAIGRVIELKLNKLADKLDFGPDATAQKITRKEGRMREYLRQHPSTSEYLDDLPDIVTTKDRKALSRLCKRLLKYTESDVLSTKLQALTKITDLALHEPFFYTLLSELNAATTLSGVHFDLSTFRDLDPVVRTASERALVVISEVNVVSLNLSIRQMIDSFEWIGLIEPLKVALTSLFSYVHDLPMSFLVLRLFSEIQSGVCSVFDHVFDDFVLATIVHALSVIVANGTSATASNDDFFSDQISWAELDSIIKTGIETWGPLKFNSYVGAHLGKLMRFAFEHSVFLPKTIASLTSTFDAWWKEAHTQDGFMHTPFYLWTVIEEEFNTFDLHKLSKRELSMAGMDVRISDTLLTLLDKLVCPAVLALRQAILDPHRWRTGAGQGMAASAFNGTLGRVVSPDTISSIVGTVLPLLECDDIDTRNRALYSLAVISQVDFYFWTETSRILRENGKSYLINPLLYPERGPWGVQHIFQTRCLNRYTGVEAFFIRQASLPLHFKISLIRRQEICQNCFEPFRQHTWLHLRLIKSDLLWYEVAPNSPYDENLHFPLQLGVAHNNAETLFLGAMLPDAGPFKLEKAKLRAISSREMKSMTDRVRGQDRLCVLVLRYDPNAYADTPHYSDERVEGAHYRTGPFFWKPFSV